MVTEKTLATEDNTLSQEQPVSKLRDYAAFVKLRLASLVVLSAAIAFVIGSHEVNWTKMLLLVLGGFLVTGSSNGFNQIIERHLDKLMERTANRPLPKERMTLVESYWVALIMGVAGIAILFVYMNPLSGLLGLTALLLYALVYTPIKRITPFAVFIGAFPGAIPPLLGYVACSQGYGEIKFEAWLLFATQFMWQFPHFWAIAWVAHNDYSKVGFKLLPSKEGPTRFTALQSVMYAVLMIPIGFLPYYLHLTGQISMWILLVANIFMVVQCIRLYQNRGVPAARRVMFSSYIYLPIVYLALLADKL